MVRTRPRRDGSSTGAIAFGNATRVSSSARSGRSRSRLAAWPAKCVRSTSRLSMASTALGSSSATTPFHSPRPPARERPGKATSRLSARIVIACCIEAIHHPGWRTSIRWSDLANPDREGQPNDAPCALRHGSRMLAARRPASFQLFPACSGRSIVVHVTRSAACARPPPSKLSLARSSGRQSIWQTASDDLIARRADQDHHVWFLIARAKAPSQRGMVPCPPAGSRVQPPLPFRIRVAFPDDGGAV
jgi:hypothetical protein